MSILHELTLHMNDQIIKVEKTDSIIVSCEFNNPSKTDLNRLFIFGCKCQGLDVKEAIDNREITLPTLNWKCGSMIIANVDRYSYDRPFTFFYVKLPLALGLTGVQKIFNEVMKLKDHEVSLPVHYDEYLVYPDGSYKCTRYVNTDIVLDDSIGVISCDYDHVEEAIKAKYNL